MMTPGVFALAALGRRKPWDVTTLRDTGKSFDPTSQIADGEGPYCMRFSASGSSMYLARTYSGGTKTIYQYSLSAPWDISTASYTSKSYTVTEGAAGGCGGFCFKPDGTKLFWLDYNSENVYRYSLSTAWDISTASYDSVYGAVSGSGSPLDLFLQPDGTRLFAVYVDAIRSYTMSTAWDTSTASYEQEILKATLLGSDCDQFMGVTFDTSGDGKKAVIYGKALDGGGPASFSRAFSVTLSTAWDISTMAYSASDYFNFVSGNGDSRGVSRPDGLMLYEVTDISNSSVINQYIFD